MKIKDPFHAGELEIQKKAGEEAIAKRNGVVIADSIMRGGDPICSSTADGRIRKR